ncbi:MAG TPA: hypothetical protein VJ950_05530 [Acidimicrobiia bacterium]|nr:hypothetical protein [Acidimicrobiia bacterium]
MWTRPVGPGRLLTLFVIPAVYSLFDGRKRRFSREDHGIDPIEPGRPAEAVSTLI